MRFLVSVPFIVGVLLSATSLADDLAAPITDNSSQPQLIFPTLGADNTLPLPTTGIDNQVTSPDAQNKPSAAGAPAPGDAPAQTQPQGNQTAPADPDLPFIGMPSTPNPNQTPTPTPPSVATPNPAPPSGAPANPKEKSELQTAMEDCQNATLDAGKACTDSVDAARSNHNANLLTTNQANNSAACQQTMQQVIGMFNNSMETEKGNCNEAYSKCQTACNPVNMADLSAAQDKKDRQDQIDRMVKKCDDVRTKATSDFTSLSNQAQAAYNCANQFNQNKNQTPSMNNFGQNPFNNFNNPFGGMDGSSSRNSPWGNNGVSQDRLCAVNPRAMGCGLDTNGAPLNNGLQATVNPPPNPDDKVAMDPRGLDLGKPMGPTWFQQYNKDHPETAPSNNMGNSQQPNYGGGSMMGMYGGGNGGSAFQAPPAKRRMGGPSSPPTGADDVLKGFYGQSEAGYRPPNSNSGRQQARQGYTFRNIPANIRPGKMTIAGAPMAFQQAWAKRVQSEMQRHIANVTKTEVATGRDGVTGPLSVNWFKIHSRYISVERSLSP